MDNAIIQVQDLVKAFGGKVPVRALDGLDLTVERGGVYGLLGPNGAGKTTLIRVLATLLEPDRGRVRVAGIDVRRHPAEVRARIGLAGQYAAVDDHLTGRENVEMVGRLYGLPRRQARRQAVEVLERIGLTQVADRQVRTYSGGMRRRLDLAASLVGRPQVLFLDEPTAGLDPQARRGTWDLVRDLRADGVSVILTTHYMDEAEQLADDVAIIDGGRVIAQGTPEELCRGGAENTLRFMGRPGLDVGSLLKALPADCSAAELTPGSYRVVGKVNPQLLATVTSWCAQHGVMPEKISVERHTLEDVFLELTGKELRA
jgi:ABC-2 type transport system ATP-binding protein